MTAITQLLPLLAQQDQQALLEFGNTTLERVSRGQSLSQVLDFIVCNIEAKMPEIRCSILLLDPKTQSLYHAAAPNLPESYQRLINGVQIGADVGSCGTAAYLRIPVLSTDIASDPLWLKYQELAATYHLGACWSSPVLSTQGDVLGTFAVYWREALTGDLPVELQTYIATATLLVAIVLERTQREQALTDAQQHLQQQVDELRRWQQVMLNREKRVLELKAEVNLLLLEQGKPPRYTYTVTTTALNEHKP